MTAAVAFLVCGGCADDKKATSTTSSGAPTRTGDCIEQAVNVLNQLDVSQINPDDGIDDSERANLNGQVDKLMSEHPELGSNSPCDAQLRELRDDQASVVIQRIRPEVAVVLGASARQTFSSVANSIN